VRERITGYARMWPREVLYKNEEAKVLQKVKGQLGHPGVYILYRDEIPYYIGKTERKLFRRIWAHANRPRTKYFNFWNFFSAFVVSDRRYVDEIEAILISSLPTANRAVPKLRRIDLPNEIWKELRKRGIP